MAKLKVKNRHGVIPHGVLSNKKLSWKAKGLFGYIQSKPENWDFAIERMEGKDGKDSTRSGIQELERFGYLTREKIRLPDGTYDVEYTLSEEPNHSGKSSTDEEEEKDETPEENFDDDQGGKPAMDEDDDRGGFTVAENPTAENPTAENPPYNKERNTKKEIVIKNNTSSNEEVSVPQTFGDPGINAIIDSIKSKHGTIDGTTKQNRYYGSLLKKKLDSMEGFNGDYRGFILSVIENSDKYTIGYTTSCEGFYRNLAKLLAKIRAEYSEEKQYKGVQVGAC